MSVEITAVHMSGGDKHEHIADVKWTNKQTSDRGESTRAVMVDWIENQKGQAVVTNGKNTVNVGVVDATPKYLRTYADGIWTDNLLALPRY
jgi:catechol-2,3-dioxygenase